ncbi:MAG: AraC family transcriptional regulator [Clostridia bacterium]|nr:AraC family transcriptional regulator [Clostridia bacterium]
MDVLKQLNAAVLYIEDNLCAEPDVDAAARLACVTTDTFLRFFSYMTGMTLAEYVRRRRLSRAAEDACDREMRVIDIAVKYGYDSADAFSRAFKKQHGMTPAAYRKYGGRLKIYPPLSFHINIKGAKEMDFQMIELTQRKVYGLVKPYAGQGYQTREALRHTMWSDECEDVPGQLCDGRWNQKDNTAYDGIWYGIWQNGNYMIAREKDKVKSLDGLSACILPAGRYATFKTTCGGVAWEEFPKLFSLIFDSWLPNSGYRQSEDLAIEVLHLWTDHDLRQKKRYYEVWIPIEKI